MRAPRDEMMTGAAIAKPAIVEPMPIPSPKADRLVEMGGDRWVAGGHDRVYLNDAVEKILGLRVVRYSSGAVKAVYDSDGDKMSNSKAQDILTRSARAYYDVKADRFVGLAAPATLRL